KIDCVQILPALFGTVIIPAQVGTELRADDRPLLVRQFMESSPGWLLERSPNVLEPISELHAGETAAICLAQELDADLLLIDEALGRKIAASKSIRITGTIGVLDRAARQGLINLDDAFQRIRQTNFRVSSQLLEETLKDYQASLAKKQV